MFMLWLGHRQLRCGSQVLQLHMEPSTGCRSFAKTPARNLGGKICFLNFKFALFWYNKKLEFKFFPSVQKICERKQ